MEGKKSKHGREHKRFKKSRRERELGYADTRDLEVETGRKQVVPHASHLEVSNIRKKEKRSRKEGELEVRRSDDISTQTVVGDGGDNSEVDSVQVKTKKAKKSHRNRETELVGLGNQSRSDGDGVRDQEVIRDGVDDYDEQSLPKKKKARVKNCRNMDVAGEDLLDSIYLGGDRVTDKAVLKGGVDNIDTQSFQTKKKKRKEFLGDRDMEVEEFGTNISTYGNGRIEQEVDENNQFRLESSSVRKKEGKKSRRGKQTEHEGHLDSNRVQNQVVLLSGVEESLEESLPVTKVKTKVRCQDSDIVQNEIASRVRIVESLEGSVPVKKVKKTVRFQEPEIHWREEDKDEEHRDEEDVGSEVYKLEDKDKSSGLCIEEEPVPKYLTDKRFWEEGKYRDDLTYGYFSKEEDEKLRTTVYDYIKEKNWDHDVGLYMLLHSTSHPEARGAWITIGRCLPHRSLRLVNSRAHRLLSPLKRGKWSEEEAEKLKELYELHGHKWKAIEKVMGRPAQLCKDKWRALRLAPTMKKGRFSSEELDQLCMYVRWNLKVKENLMTRKRHLLRDDINWEIIGEKMCRLPGDCSRTWYTRLASSLVSDGNWGISDDRRLLKGLMETGASSEEDIDWDRLLDDRDGRTCEWRWYQMKRLLPCQRLPFEDTLEEVIKRYAPDLIGIQENFSICIFEPVLKNYKSETGESTSVDLVEDPQGEL